MLRVCQVRYHVPEINFEGNITLDCRGLELVCDSEGKPLCLQATDLETIERLATAIDDFLKGVKADS